MSIKKALFDNSVARYITIASAIYGLITLLIQLLSLPVFQSDNSQNDIQQEILKQDRTQEKTHLIETVQVDLQIESSKTSSSQDSLNVIRQKPDAKN